MDTITVHFEFEKETKNTVRFKEVVQGDARPTIGTIYVLKSVLRVPPKRLVVEIKEEQ